jgi:hypothetical protein
VLLGQSRGTIQLLYLLLSPQPAQQIVLVNPSCLFRATGHHSLAFFLRYLAFAHSLAPQESATGSQFGIFTRMTLWEGGCACTPNATTYSSIRRLLLSASPTVSGRLLQLLESPRSISIVCLGFVLGRPPFFTFDFLGSLTLLYPMVEISRLFQAERGTLYHDDCGYRPCGRLSSPEA